MTKYMTCEAKQCGAKSASSINR